MRRSTLRAGLQVAAEHPGLLVWYLQNRLRQVVLPVEQRRTDGWSLHPRFITLKPTLRCNLRCEFCRFVANGAVFGARDWMELEDWVRVLDEVAPHRPYACITGGEPTLYPHLPELIAHVKRRGMICVLTTNGTLLEKKAATLAEAGPDLVILSIDGPRDVHDQVRLRDGTYERALAGARALRSAVSGKQKAARLVLNAAITGQTWRSALELVEVAREFDAFALNFQHFWFLTRSMVDEHNARYGDCFPLNFDQVGGTSTEGVDADGLFETIARLKSTDFGFPVLFYPELGREEMRAYYGQPEQFTHRLTPACAWISTDILPNGDVSPCFDLVVGNVLETPFREIWNGDEFRAHRRRLSAGGPYSICARCCAYFRKD
jgi:MoaA/NifB/PqqE/SkfB family radical SAM enzyme